MSLEAKHALSAALYALARADRTKTEVASVVTTVTEVGGAFVENEVPGGACDGVRTAFALARAPIPGSVRLYLSGVRITAFTLAGSAITLAVAPLATDNLLADYRYAA